MSTFDFKTATPVASGLTNSNFFFGADSQSATDPTIYQNVALRTYLLGTSTSTLSIAAGKTLTVSNILTFTGTDSSSVAFGAGGTVLYSSSAIPLTVGTTTIASGTDTRILYNNAGVLGQYTLTGSGTVAVMQNTPTLTTPVLGVATATSINGLTITSSTGTLTITNAKVLSVSKTLTLDGTDSTTMTFPTTSATIARTDAGQTFTGASTATSWIANTFDARGTWSAGATWTLPAFTLGGTVSGGGQQLNNIIIGTSTPLAGTFTTLVAGTSTTSPILATGADTGTIKLGTSSDVILAWDAANTLALRNSTNAQTLRVYETYTDASNYSRLAIGYNVSGFSAFEVVPQYSGTGTERGIYFGDRANSAAWQIQADGTVVLWQNSGAPWIWIPTGHFAPTANATYDFGDTTNRVRAGYFATLSRTVPVTETNSTHTLAATTTSLICNRAGDVAVTLGAASSYPGREIFIKTIQAQTVSSASSNVVPSTSATAGTAICPATDGAWALLVSNGTDWVIMAANPLV